MLFEAEVAEELGLGPYVPRRNIVVRGASLEGLVGIRFRLRGALLAGRRRRDPCRYIEQITGVRGPTKALARECGVCAPASSKAA